MNKKDNFLDHLKFSMKSPKITSITNFSEKSKSWSKLQIFGLNKNVRQTIFWTKIFLDKNITFEQKYNFGTKIYFLDKILIFGQKP